MKSSDVIIPVMKFSYHKLPIDKKGTEEEFDFFVPYTYKFKNQFKKKAGKWCQKNCEKKYVMRTYGCWFQTREDAEAFRSKWL